MMRATICVLAAIGTLAGCVQQAHDRTVVYELDVSGRKDVTAVGIRGSDTPLSWDRDSALATVSRDSLYRVVVTYRTGYLVTGAKFTVNGEFELQKGPNRRIVFEGDTTVYRARFDQPR